MQERDLTSKQMAYVPDLRCLITLAVLAVAIRTWQITHTEVASRDSISYVRIAWQLEHAPWKEVMPASPQHPGYPLAVLAMSYPMRQILPDDLPGAWQFSAQLVSALASVLLLVPMFYLGKEIFDRNVAFWACLLFQCLPTSGKIMGDGLSDTLFILFACTGLWLATVALRRRETWLFALTGLAGGLAYWVRPEGALIVAATGLVLVAIQKSQLWRQEWRRVVIQGTTLSLSALAVSLPYMLIIGGLTVKNTPNILINQQRHDADWEKRLRPQPAAKAEPHAEESQAGSTLFAAWFGPGDRTFEKLAKGIGSFDDLKNYRMPSRYLWALNAFILEAGKGFFYIVWMPMLFGLWWWRERFRAVPGLWIGLLVCLALLVLLFRMAEKMGYLSDRHLLFVILCGTYWAVAGTLVIGEKLARGAVALFPRFAGRPWMEGWTWSLALLLLLVLAPMPRTLARLHSERAGFRSLGQWLAKNTLPGDFIDDPYCWAYYYAGRVFVEGSRGLPMHKPSRFYVILEESKNRHPRLEELVKIVKGNLHQRCAKMIYAQKSRRGRDDATLQVWEVPGSFHQAPLPPLQTQRRD